MQAARRLLLSSLPLLVLSGASAQTGTTPAPTPSPQLQTRKPEYSTPITVLRTGANLVVVDVVVHDKSGHPVHNLTRNDFVISESGKPQTLHSFEEHVAPATPVALPAAPKLPPGTFTDYTPVPATGALNVLLIDALNTPISDQGYLQEQLKQYVKQAPAGTRIAVFGLANHLYYLQGFTSDPRQLETFFNNAKNHKSTLLDEPGSTTSTSSLQDQLTDPNAPASATSSSASSSGSALMTNNMQTFLELVGVQQTSLRITETIEAFTDLGHYLLNFPGRKNLIWFSGAFPLGVVPTASVQNNTDIPSEDSDQFRNMTNLLTKAQVTVYPVDPQGVQVPSGFQAADSSTNQIAAFTTNNSNFFLNMDANHATMQAIATDTGGEPFYNRNDLVKAVNDAINAGADYYTVSYTPSERKTGGEWRSIKIEAEGRNIPKGVHLAYRHGYFADNLKNPAHHIGSAETTTDPSAPNPVNAAYVRAAMTHGAPAPADLVFTTRVLPASTTTEDAAVAGNVLNPKNPLKPPFRRFDVDCAAAARSFHFLNGTDSHHLDAIQLAVFVYDANGKLLNTASKDLRLDLTPENYARFQQMGVTEHLEVSAPANAESFFRIGLLDKASGHIGVVEVPVSSVIRLPPPEYASLPATAPSVTTAPGTTLPAPH